MDEADAVLAALPHPDNPDPGAPNFLQRIEPLLEGPGGDDLAIMFGRGVDVVVVIIEAGLFELARLAAG
jgi:hypothetical protein